MVRRPSDQKVVRDYLIARVLVETLQRMKPKYPLATAELRLRSKKELG